MTELFVDTSAWYALIDAKSHTHIQVKNLLKRYEHSLITSNFIIDETITFKIIESLPLLAQQYE